MLGTKFVNKNNFTKTLQAPNGRLYKQKQFEYDMRKHLIVECWLDSLGCACFSEYFEKGSPKPERGLVKTMSKRFAKSSSRIKQIFEAASRAESHKLRGIK